MSDAVQNVTAEVSGGAPETEVTDGGRTHADRIKWIHSFTTTASDWLLRSMRDDDYYHSIQWTTEEKDILRNRQPAGQPVVTINRIAPKINRILGVRQRFRMSPAGLPRSPNHENDGDAFSDIMSFLVDSTKFAEAEDAANEDIGKVGYGGYILGLREVEELVVSPPPTPQAEAEEKPIDPDAKPDPEKKTRTRQEITCTHVPWDEYAWDARSRRMDYEDGMWRAILKWRDIDDVRTDPQYADAADIIKQTSESTVDITSDGPFAEKPDSWFDSKTRQMQVAEMYYRGASESVRGWDYYVCHMTGAGDLIPPKLVTFIDEDGFTWNPLKFGTAYKNRHGERYGFVRNFVSPQDELNHRRSRFLYGLASPGYWYESDAIESASETSDELAKASPALKLLDGAMSDKESGPKFGFIDKTYNNEGQWRMLQDAKADIDAIGPTALSDASGVTGPALAQQQDDGIAELGPAFGRMKSLRHTGVTGLWLLARQFWTEERYIRVMDKKAKNGLRFLPVNRVMTRAERAQDLMQKGMPPPEAMSSALGEEGADLMAQTLKEIVAEANAKGVQMPPEAMQGIAMKRALASPLAQEKFTHNDIAQLSVDIVLDEKPHHAIAAQEQLQGMMAMQREGVAKFPEKMFIENSDLPDKEKILADMEPPPPDPNAVQAQQMQVQLNLASLKAQVEAITAQAAKWGAEAQAVGARANKDVAQAGKLQAETVRVGSEIEENEANAEKLEAEAAVRQAQASNPPPLPASPPPGSSA